MTLLDHCLYNFTVFFLLDIFVYIFYYEYFAYFHRKKAKLLSHYYLVLLVKSNNCQEGPCTFGIFQSQHQLLHCLV